MLIVTDFAAVQAAFNAKTPRPMRDIMLEIYPDATEDRNGRFHAPHDGYICPITDREFRAGEYLPMEEPEDGYRVTGVTHNFPQAIDLAGDLHKWDGTRAQNIAVWGVLIEQTRAHTSATSEFVGVVGEKITMELNVAHIHRMEGIYGYVYINIMTDGAGNVVIYKGAKAIGKKGACINVSGKVKMHALRDGVKQTTIERPKVL